MYIARHAISIGPRGFAPGDTIDRDAQLALPAGRMMQLVEQGAVVMITDEASFEKRISDLEDIVAGLAAKINAMEIRRGPGRPRKEDVESLT